LISDQVEQQWKLADHKPLLSDQTHENVADNIPNKVLVEHLF